MLKYQGTLKSVRSITALIEKLKAEVDSNLGNKERLKFNLDLVREICCSIETQYAADGLAKDGKKLELFFDIYTQIFGQIDERDRQWLESCVSYLHTRGLIKATPFLKRLLKSLFHLLFAKKG